MGLCIGITMSVYVERFMVSSPKPNQLEEQAITNHKAIERYETPDHCLRFLLNSNGLIPKWLEKILLK
ncbi:MAG: hypothetical protein A4E57_00330 [Syntrophorhabdaceae bacterium PtaU1.Bin034]|nr:MAG: hypothetical protein A4E57_00330 [Syntrophorhabdaceae bacterium PtaU1.Bin034]